MALASGLAVELWLMARQEARARRNRGTAPAPLHERFPATELERASDYTVAKLRARRAALLFDAALLLLWTLGGGLSALDRALAGRGVPFLLAAHGIAGLLHLPLVLYRVFAIEARFGFNRTTPRRFLADVAKQALLFFLLATPLFWAALAAMRLGWLAAWAGFTAVSALLGWAFPVLVAPRFNRFTPLPEGELKERVRALLARCGFRESGVFVMDASRRSTHSNAYFTGLGSAKRVVLFDTLVERMAPDEVEAILAHELAHHRLGHLVKGFALTAAVSLVAFALLGFLRDRPWFCEALGMRPSDHGTLLLILWVGPVVVWPLRPVAAYLSRRREQAADAFAAKLTGPAPLQRALLKLYADNAANLDPDPLYSAFHDGHPPPLSRLARLNP